MIRPLQLSHYTVASALGLGVASHRAALENNQSGLRRCDFPQVNLETWIGRVDATETTPVALELAEFECRNNRLAEVCLQQDDFNTAVAAAANRYGADRIGVFIGTSTSGVQQTEEAYAHRDATKNLPSTFNYRTTQNMYSAGDYVRRALGLKGPGYVVSTACSSSAKVFAIANRFIAAGICDAAVIGGVDSLCQMTLYGFNSLQLVSPQPCRPYDADRDGISIGEAAGFALVEPAVPNSASICLLGYGESSDAYHMSTPHPEGKGARIAMEQALQSANLSADRIDYINLHGTGTRANDSAEDHAVFNVFGNQTPCSSTKGHTGHTLGAAGILEAIICCIALENDFIPGTTNTRRIDPRLRSSFLFAPVNKSISFAMTNSFGFGGNNVSLVFGRAA